MKLLTQILKRVASTRPKKVGTDAEQASFATLLPALGGVSATDAIHRRIRGNLGVAISAESPSIAKPAATRTTHLCDGDRLTLHVAKSSSEVEQLRGFWKRWNRHLHCDIDSFLSLDRHHQDILRPHVMVVYRQGRVECILVGRLEKGRTSFSMGGAKILLPQAKTLYFLYEGFLGKQSEESSTLLVQGIMESLYDGEADFAELSQLRVDSPLYRAARHLPSVLCRDHFPATVQHRSLILPNSFQDLVASLSRKDRHNFRRQKNRLLEKFSGQVRIQCFRREDELEVLVRDVEEVAKKSYLRIFGMGFFDKCETKEELRREARKGRLYGYVLYLTDKPSAFIIGQRYQGTFSGRSMGYDPEYSRYSPGSFLLMHCLEQCFLEDAAGKIVRVDFGPGNQRYKRIWFREDRQEATVNIFAPTFKARGLNLLRTVLVVVHQSGRWFIAKTNIRDNASRTWRMIVTRYRNGKARVSG